jgi:hypothetical protein
MAKAKKSKEFRAADAKKKVEKFSKAYRSHWSIGTEKCGQHTGNLLI